MGAPDMSAMIPVQQFPIVIGKMSQTRKSPANANGVLPGDAELRAALTANAASWPGFITGYLNTAIQPYWNAQLKADLDKFARRATDVPGERVPLIDLDPKWNRKQREPHLDLKLAGNLNLAAGNPDTAPLIFDILDGLAIARPVLDGGGALPAIATQNDAVRVMHQLRAFEGCVIRLTAARGAAARTLVGMPDAPTLYREEGNLIAPSSRATLDLGVPPIEQRFKYTLAFKDVDFIPNLANGVFLMDKADFLSAWGGTDQEFVKAMALGIWFLVLVGFDFFTARVFDGSQDVGTVRANYADLSSRFWGLAGLDGTAAAAGGRFDSLFANLRYDEIQQGANTIIRVTPVDPVVHVEGILAEGLAFLKLFFNQPLHSPKLSYLAYNSQAKQSDDPDDDQYTQILVSAMFFANRSSKPMFAALKAALQGVPFPPKLKDYAAILTLVADNAPHLDLENLFEFIVDATRTDWPFWQEHRANLRRCFVLVVYYSFAEA
jgi:hypothetical protein